VKVEDPVLFLYASFDRHLPGHVVFDPRKLPLRLFRRYQRTWGLDVADPSAQPNHVKDINLDKVDQAESDLIEWTFRSRSVAGQPTGSDGGPKQPPRRQAALYTYADALTFYAMDALGSTTEDFAEAWNRLSECPRFLLGTKHWEKARVGFFGLNVVCSVLWNDEREGSPSEREVREALACISSPRAARIDTWRGQLWAVDSGWLDLPVDPRLMATWVLVSPKPQGEEVYQALQLGGPTPPTLSRLLAARQKFWWQLGRYEEGRGKVRRARESVDKRVRWLITTQRDFEDSTKITDSQEMEELRFKSARAHTDVAAFAAEVVRIGDARTTLEINLGNYTSFASDLRLPKGEDEFFGGEIGRMEAAEEQVRNDVTYHQGALGRARAALASGDAGFNVSQDRQAGRSVRLGVVQVSGLFASLMALIATEALRLGEVARLRPWFAAKIILLVLVGSFALAQVLQAWRSVRTKLTSSGMALALGLAVLLVLAPDANAWWHYVLGALAAAVAFGAARLLEERRRRDTEPAWRKIRETESQVDKLRRANQEISDLLDDLPTTRFHRLKDDVSFLEKIERKQREGRPGYSAIDVEDSIGMRYVVSPFQLPVVVDRVERILDRRAVEIEYKAGRYKAVHIEVDVLGVGAREDLNLKAEVQIKTYLQHLYALLGHDVLYKDVPEAGGPLWLRPIKAVLRLAKGWKPTYWLADRLLALPAAVEMLIFRRWMRWPKGGEPTIRPPKWVERESREGGP
jgi:hypothetical protein